MNELENKIRQLTEEFEGCQKLLVALGDESRQRITCRYNPCKINYGTPSGAKW